MLEGTRSSGGRVVQLVAPSTVRPSAVVTTPRPLLASPGTSPAPSGSTRAPPPPNMQWRSGDLNPPENFAMVWRGIYRSRL